MAVPTESTGASDLRADQANKWLVRAMGLSAGAGLIHLMITPEHLEHWIGYGLFFLAAAAAQLIYPVLLIRQPGRGWLLAGIVGNGLIIGLYLVTRTIGIPFFGPDAWRVEPIGRVDVVSKLAEVALIVSLIALLRSHPAAERAS